MTGRLDLVPTPIHGLTVVERKPIGDSRGFLERMYCADELGAIGLTKPIRQINRTLTQKKGTVRGMHFQHPPASEVKIVTCLRGKVFDIAVDLRTQSPTFLQWYGVELSGSNNKTLLIPEGFAHGFQTLEENCELLYMHTHDYAPKAEGGINSRDQRLAITWPEPITEMSDRDASLPSLDQDFAGLNL